MDNDIQREKTKNHRVAEDELKTLPRLPFIKYLPFLHLITRKFMPLN